MKWVPGFCIKSVSEGQRFVHFFYMDLVMPEAFLFCIIILAASGVAQACGLVVWWFYAMCAHPQRCDACLWLGCDSWEGIDEEVPRWGVLLLLLVCLKHVTCKVEYEFQNADSGMRGWEALLFDFPWQCIFHFDCNLVCILERIPCGRRHGRF